MRNAKYGYIPWEELEPGESIEIPRTYNSVLTTISRTYPNRRYTTTIKGAADDKRILIRLA